MKNDLQEGKTRWCHYNIAYHLVWIPKYRRKILTGDIQKVVKKTIEQYCEQNEWKLIAIETDIDHVHCFVSAPPRWSPARIVGLLKGYTSFILRKQFPRLKIICGKDSLWTSAYYVGTAGNMSAQTIIRYITECQGR
jgi:putative transposase